MSARATTILERFPRHLDADAPGKRVGAVVDHLSGDLDVVASQLRRVRRAHRVRLADEQSDLLALAALHDVSASDVELLARRLAAIGAASAAVAAVPPEDELSGLDDVDADLAELVAMPAGALGPAAGRRDRLLAALEAVLRHAAEMDRLRGLLRALVDNHRSGNGSVRSILTAAAAHLHLGPDGDIAHSPDRYWHFLQCRDLLTLGTVTPAADVVALEENPFRPADLAPAPRLHAERFSVFRRGFDEAAVTVVVRGIDDRTKAPMVVNVDTGVGVVFTGTVPDAGELTFERDGRVLLHGGDVGSLAYRFEGAVFADAGKEHANDFTWDDAVFAVTHPVDDAFDGMSSFPHAIGRVESQRMSTGESRWALFVGVGAFAGDDGTGAPALVAPAFAQAVFDRSVYADRHGLAPPAAEVGFRWHEREPFAAVVWIPVRFAVLDGDPSVPPARERLRVLLDRHRPAGVHLYVQYADDRWTLGEGVLRDPGSTEATGVVVVGTRLWSTPEPPPD